MTKTQDPQELFVAWARASAGHAVILETQQLRPEDYQGRAGHHVRLAFFGCVDMHDWELVDVIVTEGTCENSEKELDE